MEAELINLSDYVYSGEGANGASYNHRSDSSIMVKLYNPSMELGLIETEVGLARKVYDAGIPSPEPGAFVTDGQGRYGIRFRRMVGKVSYARAIGLDPTRVEEYSRSFARLCLALHSTRVDRTAFPDVKQQYLTMLEENPFCTAEEKSRIRTIIESTPDADTAIHGDLSFGNALMVGGQSCFIDLGEFAVGNPLFDLGMVAITGLYNDQEFTRSAFHMSSADANAFFGYFVDEYFGGRMTAFEADMMLRPYAVVKALLIERNAKMRMDTYHDMLASLDY